MMRCGFYEAQWGYLLDSQPDYVMNVAEQFDLTGGPAWLAGQKTACERALDFLTAPGGPAHRPRGHDDRLPLKHSEGSDWIDIIWASYENALINAELYYALDLWAEAEERWATRPRRQRIAILRPA